MDATIVDLRYRMNEVLKALDRREDVRVLYHGKLKGILAAGSVRQSGRIHEHPFFNMRRSAVSVDEEMVGLRGGRHGDL